jgi:hypothetical protein
MQLNARISADRTLRVPAKPRLFDYGFGDLLPGMRDIAIYTASSAGARCAMLGGGGIGEHEASAVTGGGGIEEQVTAVSGGGGTDEQDARAVAGGGGIGEHEASAVSGGGGIGEHEASAVTGGGIEEQPCAVLGGGGISDPERAGRRALADAASPAPDSISP